MSLGESGVVAGLSVVVIIPTFCERDALPAVLTGLLAVRIEGTLRIWVADDASPDGTATMVRGFQDRHPSVRLLERSGGRGRGPAVVDTMARLLALGQPLRPDVIIEMDGDGSHDPDSVAAMMRALTEGADVAVGSRYCANGSAELSGSRRALSALGNAFARWVLQLPYEDCTSGYRGYRSDCLLPVALGEMATMGHATHIELLYRLHRSGAVIREVPIHYRRRQDGRSKVRIRTIVRVAVELFGVRRATRGVAPPPRV